MYTKTTFSICTIFVALLLGGCDKPQEQLQGWVGQSVTVKFRRDYGGPDVSSGGKLIAVEATAVVIEADRSKKPNWIPKDVILSIESNK